VALTQEAEDVLARLNEAARNYLTQLRNVERAEIPFTIYVYEGNFDLEHSAKIRERKAKPKRA
jgi:hypothetical protein